MRISDWSSDVCSSDLATSRRLMRRPKSSTIRKTLSAVMPRAYTERSIQSTDISVQQAASGEIAHQRADAAGPGGRLGAGPHAVDQRAERSEEHTSELQSLMRISYAVFCLQPKKRQHLRN